MEIYVLAILWTLVFAERCLNFLSSFCIGRVAVTRSRNIPRFGPAIPEKCMFVKSATFREFLLTKIINGENTAHVAGKFKVTSRVASLFSLSRSLRRLSVFRLPFGNNTFIVCNYARRIFPEFIPRWLIAELIVSNDATAL